MFFGGFSGATAFYPGRIRDSSYLPNTVLTDFRLSGVPVAIGSRSPLNKSITYTDSITLSHRQNIFAIEFSALSYFNAVSNRYRYKLEGLDNQWHEVGSAQRLASYTTLPWGKYTFRVQGATSRGAWSEPGAALSIEILPPWWGTWWFGVSCVGGFVLLLWALYQLRLQQLQRQFNMTLEARVGERTRIVQRLCLYARSPRIDFVTDVDWHERQSLLKVAVPTGIRNRRATYEIQFGTIDRPTHRNTSWEEAAFEVPAQRWADLSDAHYGVALLADCKHGYRVREDTLWLSLLKGAIDPDPDASNHSRYA